MGGDTTSKLNSKTYGEGVSYGSYADVVDGLAPTINGGTRLVD